MQVAGTEPGPVYFDVGSGPDMPSTTHWSAYDGRSRRPRAEALRAVCACGWRGPAQADVDLTGPLADWTAHLSVVRAAAVPPSCQDRRATDRHRHGLTPRRAARRRHAR
ncbi:hypothetical protein B6R96_00195 [Streptomyces sp. Sge12]|uniref:hypothetical protein n=1 Tax=Streptomyces sp. Sge12 TaxID=1972846 RepID=UPI0009C367B2|nr:hypothetical protein [Streptomyces sp. Sge12]ARE72566.1 hypothetical protein B6R96_00195 [Streptomyces sp. Sge12]